MSDWECLGSGVHYDLGRGVQVTVTRMVPRGTSGSRSPALSKRSVSRTKEGRSASPLTSHIRRRIEYEGTQLSKERFEANQGSNSKNRGNRTLADFSKDTLSARDCNPLSSRMTDLRSRSKENLLPIETQPGFHTRTATKRAERPRKEGMYKNKSELHLFDPSSPRHPLQECRSNSRAGLGDERSLMTKRSDSTVIIYSTGRDERPALESNEEKELQDQLGCLVGKQEAYEFEISKSIERYATGLQSLGLIKKEICVQGLKTIDKILYLVRKVLVSELDEEAKFWASGLARHIEEELKHRSHLNKNSLLSDEEFEATFRFIGEMVDSANRGCGILSAVGKEKLEIRASIADQLASFKDLKLQQQQNQFNKLQIEELKLELTCHAEELEFHVQRLSSKPFYRILESESSWEEIVDAISAEYQRRLGEKLKALQTRMTLDKERISEEIQAGHRILIELACADSGLERQTVAQDLDSMEQTPLPPLLEFLHVLSAFKRAIHNNSSLDKMEINLLRSVHSCFEARLPSLQKWVLEDKYALLEGKRFGVFKHILSFLENLLKVIMNILRLSILDRSSVILGEELVRISGLSSPQRGRGGHILAQTDGLVDRYLDEQNLVSSREGISNTAWTVWAVSRLKSECLVLEVNHLIDPFAKHALNLERQTNIFDKGNWEANCVDWLETEDLINEFEKEANRFGNYSVHQFNSLNTSMNELKNLKAASEEKEKILAHVVEEIVEIKETLQKVKFSGQNLENDKHLETACFKQFLSANTSMNGRRASKEEQSTNMDNYQSLNVSFENAPKNWKKLAGSLSVQKIANPFIKKLIRILALDAAGLARLGEESLAFMSRGMKIRKGSRGSAGTMKFKSLDPLELYMKQTAAKPIDFEKLGFYERVLGVNGESLSFELRNPARKGREAEVETLKECDIVAEDITKRMIMEQLGRGEQDFKLSQVQQSAMKKCPYYTFEMRHKRLGTSFQCVFEGLNQILYFLVASAILRLN